MKLCIENVGKRYGGNAWALRRFSLELQPGVLGLLGPNGAGKTTLMNILATITRASEGTVTWNGTDVAADPNELRAVLGYLPQDFGVYPNLSAQEFLEYLAAVKGLDAKAAQRRIDQLLNVVNLADVRGRPLGGFSGGMKQRVGIAQALLNDPRLLIVDEPTAGLDPEERVRFRNLLSDLSGERIVSLSTHIVSDVEATATDIALISNGGLVAHAAPEELLRRVEGRVWEWVIPSADLNAAQRWRARARADRRAAGRRAAGAGDAGRRVPGCAVGLSRRGAGVSSGRVLWHLVKADFLTRVRRMSFLVTLAFAVFLGYQVFAGNIVMQLDDYRGVYNSAWVGALMGVVTSTFLTLAGFYIVKGSILRDETTRLGQILAATPMSKSFYTIAKFLGNFAVLAAMVAVMGAAALAMLLMRGEDRTLHLWTLLSPLLLCALPAMAFVAALAVLFETLPVLRGGVGNVVWFFVWIGLLIVAVGPTATHSGAARPTDAFRDFSGMPTVMGQMRVALLRVDPKFQNGFSLSIGSMKPHQRFLWTGVQWDAVQLTARLLWFVYALVAALLAAVFFHRFDPACEGFSRRRKEMPERAPVVEFAAAKNLVQADPWTHRLTPLEATGTKNRFFALVGAELRLMLKGHKWWWYAVAAALFVACAASPLPAASGGVILAAWIWPLLIWSQMGGREARYAMGSLIFSAPHALDRQLPATWVAGVMVTLATGGGLLARLLIAGDGRAVAGFLAAVLFIPSLAMACGILTGGSKLFEAIYVAWWYTGAAHHLRGLDYMGTVAASSTPVVYLVVTVALLGVCWTRRRTQLAYA